MIAMKGCPPSPKAISQGLRRAGIQVSPEFFENGKRISGIHMKKYEGKPEFDESFFRVV
jgi:hypothetical protein